MELQKNVYFLMTWGQPIGSLKKVRGRLVGCGDPSGVSEAKARSESPPCGETSGSRGRLEELLGRLRGLGSLYSILYNIIMTMSPGRPQGAQGTPHGSPKGARGGSRWDPQAQLEGPRGTPRELLETFWSPGESALEATLQV